MIKALIKLILEFIQEDKSKSLFNSFYAPNDTPKTFGTKIKRRV